MITTVSDIIKTAIEKCKKAGTIKAEKIPDIIVEKSKKDEFGDFATNAAMLLAKEQGKPPRQIAELIAKEVRLSENVKKAEIAGPGFINIFMKDDYWLGFLKDIHAAGENFGKSSMGAGKKILLEFVSANPTGPLHIGHGRGAAVGDTLANILKAAGYDVKKEFYVNDRGVQVYTLGNSVRFRCRELQGKDDMPPQDYYKGEYVKDIARDFASKYGNNADVESTEAIIRFVDFAKDALLKQIEKDLEDFGVVFDEWYSEKKELYDTGLVFQTLDELEKRNVTKEEEGALWFKTQDFGDDKDRVLRKADGELTYFASDVAYHKKKVERGFSTLVNIWGADHHGYEERVRAALKVFAPDSDDSILKIIFIQLVSLVRNGVPVPMGKREGEFVTLRQVLDEVGPDACRFFFLMRKSDAHMEFDLELAKKQAPENPVFYVQYAHARICSIIKHAEGREQRAEGNTGEVDIKCLSLKEESDIIKKLASFPDLVKGSAAAMEPHRITFYLQELAGMFHPYYNKNRVVTEDKGLTRARLYLCEAIKTVLQNGLGLLGVSAPEEM